MTQIRQWFRLRARRGAIVVWAAVLLVVVLGMVAFAIDVGYMTLTRGQLQTAADSSVLAAAAALAQGDEQIVAEARRFAAFHVAAGEPVEVADRDVEIGLWNEETRQFAPSSDGGNAVRITVRRDNASLFFGGILGLRNFSSDAEAIAVTNPRDICFVIDLSGSMNDDTEGAWATAAINSTFAGEGFPDIGNQLMQDLYDDFGFGNYPGTVEYVGRPLNVIQNQYAYAEMTKNGGPLSAGSVPAAYRVANSDDEHVRKQKAYRWIIDYQLARIMPAAIPAPNSSTNYNYWAAYIDYVMRAVTINTNANSSTNSQGRSSSSSGSSSGGSSGGGSSAPRPTTGDWKPRRDRHQEWFVAWQDSPLRRAELPPAARYEPLVSASAANWQALLLAQDALGQSNQYGTPPGNRGSIPPNRYSPTITGFNNPNKETFPKATAPTALRNYLGYLTYVQFMLDHGRDRQVAGRYTPLSVLSPDCPWRQESTAGGSFSFPPREQPTHACRRALIAALQIIKERNERVPGENGRDRVSIVTFDRLGGPGSPAVIQPLTTDYDLAMLTCTRLQATSDIGASTATEAGLDLAVQHMRPVSQGGQGRERANRVVVLLTDGVPNQWISSSSDIENYMTENESDDYYGGGYWWYDAALMQADMIRAKKWQMHPVGVGLGTDYDFMDRMARMGGTSNEEGQGARGSGNPAQYEQRLTEIFEDIISASQVRLVQ